MKSTRPPKVRRRVLVLSGIVGGLTAITAAGWPVYVDPVIDTPEMADAIVVLGGDHDGREEYGLSLAEQGYAPQIIFSNPYRSNDPRITQYARAPTTSRSAVSSQIRRPRVVKDRRFGVAPRHRDGSVSSL